MFFYATIEYFKNGRQKDNAAEQAACNADDRDNSHAFQPGIMGQDDGTKACDSGQGRQYNRPAGLKQAPQRAVEVRMPESVGKMDTVIDTDTDDHRQYHDVQEIEVHLKQGHESYQQGHSDKKRKHREKEISDVAIIDPEDNHDAHACQT